MNRIIKSTIFLGLFVMLAAVAPLRAATPQRTAFDHLTTGFELTGQHRDLPCESCHVNAIFKGTPKDCASCHGVGTAVRAPAKPATHIMSTNNCGSCHTPIAWVPAVSFDHAEALGSCSTCHVEGGKAQGKGPTHIETNLECNICHTTFGFAGATFTHTGITSGCASCHEKDKPATHIPTSIAGCEDCHSPTNYTSFAGTLMNHTAPGIQGLPCATCHEVGMSFAGSPPIVTRPALPHPATGDCAECHLNTISFATSIAMPAGHIPTTQSCSTCHANPADYGIYVMSHAGISNGCATCHDAGKSFLNMAPPVLKVIPPDHIPTAGNACEACHSPTQFTSFSGTLMNHAVVTSIPCSTCHEVGSSFAGSPPVVTRPPTEASGAQHPTTGECSACHLNTTSFKGATAFPSNHIPVPSGASSNCTSCHANANDFAIYNMDHSVVTGTACAVCHGAGKSFASMAPPILKVAASTHIPVGAAACESCHSPTNFISFAGITMNHSVVPGVACATCHGAGKSFDGLTPVVTLPGDHIPVGTKSCESCHSATNFTSFAGTQMNHAGFSSNCADCHGAGLSFVGAPPVKTLPSNHVPIGTADCETCHSNTNFTNFIMTNKSGTAPPAMVHSAVSATSCSTCHEAGSSFIGAPPIITRPALKANGTVHAASGECSDCHDNTSTFKGASDLPPNHIPLPSADNGNCALCHANPNDYSVYSMNHVNITGNCAQCHGPNKSFVNMAPPVLVVPPYNHIPTGTIACEGCHTKTNFTSFAISNTSGTAPPAMVHSVVTSIACAACHDSGKSFVGTPLVKVLPDNHIPTASISCDSCHSKTNFSSFSGTAMNHSAVTATACSACHEAGRSFAGAPPVVTRPALKANGQTHVATGECSDCHANTTSFKGASDLPPNHIPIPAADNNNCALCHANPNDYKVYSMNHVNITNNCVQCHGAGKSFANMAPPTLKVLPSNHIPTGTIACESCHSKTNFTNFIIGNTSGNAPPAMVHSAVTSIACATCHGSGKTFVGAPTVKVLPSNHIPTGSIACDSCHSATNFNTFSGTAMNHGVVTATACSACHEAGKTFVGAPPVKTRPALKANGQPHITTGECSDCHFNTTTFKGAADLPPNHIPLPAADTSCALCHSNPNDYSVYSMNHVNITSNCIQCHGTGKSFANMAPPVLKVPPSNHIPTGNIACEGCHSKTNFTNFVIPNSSGTAPPAMVHSVVTSIACVTCHGAGLTFIGSPAVKVIPGNHIPTGTVACDGCHTKGTFNTFVFANASGTAPPSMVHSVVTATACSACHEAGKTFVGSPATKVRPALKANGQAHVTGGECSTCHFNTTSFKGATDLPANHIPLPAADNNNCTLCHASGNYTQYTMNHVNITSNCVQCHGPGKSFANMAPPVLKVPPSNHVPTGNTACESCHSKTNFTNFVIPNASGTAPPAMVHSAVTSTACAACHGAGLTFVGTPAVKVLPSNHIPTGTIACDGCHSKTNFNSFVFTNASGTAPPSMVHSVVTSITCATCHAAGKTFVGTPATKVLPSNHIPTGTMACDGCHSKTNFTNFVIPNASGTAPPAMVHSLVTSIVCSTCHEKGKTFIGSPAVVVRPVNKANGQAHVAGGECSTCHFNTTSFKGATDLPTNHIPIPAADNNNCALCHTTSNYSLYVMNHVNITKNCAQCHAYGLTFANMAPPTLVQPPSGSTGHIPSNPPNGTSNIACEACHSASVFTTFAGTKMIHAAVRAMTCMSCHELGMKWKTNTGVRLWVRDGANHYKGQDCGGSGCHSTRDKHGFRRVAPVDPSIKTATRAAGAAAAGGAGASLARPGGFDHRRAVGTTCVTCHDQASGNGMPSTHIATSNACDSCHTTVTWLPVTKVDHTQVKGSCASCHNAKAARGKPGNHVASNDGCGNCHTTNAWTPARFDHQSVAAATCKGCHDGAHAAGLPVNHVPTQQQCDACHGVLAWKPAKVDHSTLKANCASCHNNAIATGLTSTHMATTIDCSTCHSYADWAVIKFAHSSAAYPGEHRAALTCISCHTSNTDKIPYAAPADAGSCGGCHAKDFKPALHVKIAGGETYSASELKNCAGACHVYTDKTLSQVGKPLPGPYHRVSDGAFKH